MPMLYRILIFLALVFVLFVLWVYGQVGWIIIALIAAFVLELIAPSLLSKRK
jgi:hypothetical protein